MKQVSALPSFKSENRSRPLLPEAHVRMGTSMDSAENPRLRRVLEQLTWYEHPLLRFDARAKGDGVEVVIDFKDPAVPVHTYLFDLHPRDLDHPQFEWTFQRQLYDCLHDYLIEMFVRTPQNKKDASAR
jgi:hypothetical protein